MTPPYQKGMQRATTKCSKTLASQVHEIVCTDVIDQTSLTQMWAKKATEQLEKLNSDCNMTDGLEAKLPLAVGEQGHAASKH